MAYQFNNPWDVGGEFYNQNALYSQFLPQGFLETTQSMHEWKKDRSNYPNMQGGIYKPIRATVISGDGGVRNYSSLSESEWLIFTREIFKITGILLTTDSKNEFLEIASIDDWVGSAGARSFLEQLLEGKIEINLPRNHVQVGIIIKAKGGNEFMNAYEVNNLRNIAYIQEHFIDGAALINLSGRDGLIFENMNPLAFGLGFGILHELLHFTGLRDFYTSLKDQLYKPGPLEDVLNVWRREMDLPERQTYKFVYDTESIPELIIEYIEFKDKAGNAGRLINNRISKTVAELKYDVDNIPYIFYKS